MSINKYGMHVRLPSNACALRDAQKSVTLDGIKKRKFPRLQREQREREIINYV